MLQQKASAEADRDCMLHQLESEHRLSIESLLRQQADALTAGLATERQAGAAATEAALAAQERGLLETHAAAVTQLEKQHAEALSGVRKDCKAGAARAVAGARDQQAAAVAAARAELAAQEAAHQAMTDAKAASFQVSISEIPNPDPHLDASNSVRCNFYVPCIAHW